MNSKIEKFASYVKADKRLLAIENALGIKIKRNETIVKTSWYFGIMKKYGWQGFSYYIQKLHLQRLERIEQAIKDRTDCKEAMPMPKK